jgi:hypothetical protein
MASLGGILQKSLSQWKVKAMQKHTDSIAEHPEKPEIEI